ncbi:hypothetical protein BDV06DRAFT_56337 [Aspergillus oleicola]
MAPRTAPNTTLTLTTLLGDRYRTPVFFENPEVQMFPCTIETILAHKSTRSFLPTPLSRGVLENLIAAAQSAPTSSMQQSYSIIAIQDSAHKDAVSRICGNQDFIRQAPLFLIFCADLNRMSRISEKYEVENKALERIDMLLTAVVDAALAAQNAVVAAEAIGLGTCFVGGVRNHAKELVELLNIPERMFGLVGLAIGYSDPSVKEEVKPRLPMEEILHYERWNGSRQEGNMRLFDEVMGRHHHRLLKIGRRPWSEFVAEWEADGVLDGRENMRALLEDQGFGLN